MTRSAQALLFGAIVAVFAASSATAQTGAAVSSSHAAMIATLSSELRRDGIDPTGVEYLTTSQAAAVSAALTDTDDSATTVKFRVKKILDEAAQ